MKASEKTSEISKQYTSTFRDLIDSCDCDLQDALTEGKISKEQYDKEMERLNEIYDAIENN